MKALKNKEYVDVDTLREAAKKQYKDIEPLNNLNVSHLFSIDPKKTQRSIEQYKYTERLSGLSVGNVFTISPNRTLRTLEQYPWICSLKTR